MADNDWYRDTKERAKHDNLDELEKQFDDSFSQDQVEKGIKDLENHANSSHIPYKKSRETVFNKAKRLLLKNRKKAIAGGLSIGIIGAGISGLVFISKPFELVQFSEILQDSYFFNNEEASDSRTRALVRWLKYPNDPQQRRLGYVGQKVADKIETDLFSKGVSLEYGRQPGGRSTGYLNRIVEFEDGEISRVRDLDDVSNNRRRGALYDVFRSKGYGRFQSAIHARILAKKGGVNFRIFGNIKRGIGETYQDYRSKVLDSIKDYVKKGVEFVRGVSVKTDDADQEAKAAADGYEGEVKNDVDKIKADYNSSQGSKNGSAIIKGAAGGTAGLVGLICIARSLSNSASDLKYVNTIYPLMRLGWMVVTMGDQIRSGEDITADEVGVFVQQLSDEETGSWLAAAPIQHELGQPVTGEDVPISARLEADRNFLSWLDRAPVISQVCGALETPIIGGILSIVSVVTDPFGEAVEEGLLRLFGDDIVRWLAGDEVPLDETGATMGAMIAHGALHGANQQAIGKGGVVLGEMATLEYKRLHQEELKYAASKTTFFDKYLSLSNPYSFLATTYRKIDSILSADLLSNVSKLLGSAMKVPSDLLLGVSGYGSIAHAASNDYDYGTDIYGIPPSELYDNEVDNPFANAENLQGSLSSIGKDINDMHSDIGKQCFGVTISEGSGSQPSVSMEFHETPYYEIPGWCKNDGHGQYPSPLLKMYRMYVLDLMNLESMNCYYGDNASCENIGVGTEGTSSGGAHTTVDGVDCPSNLEPPNSTRHNYYLLPDAPNGEYTSYSEDAEQYGSKTLICVLYTVGKAYKSKYGDSSTLAIGDINSAGHASHRWGVAVDLDAKGELFAANHTNGNYNTEATVELGKMFVDTGTIAKIWWCEPGDGSTATIRQYAQNKGTPITIMCIEGHHNHFHVDIRCEYSGPEDLPYVSGHSGTPGDICSDT